MSRRTTNPAIAALTIACAATSAAAQPARPPDDVFADTEAGADVQIESYLDRLGLNDLLLIQLQDRLASTKGDERVAVATRLADLYAGALATTFDPDESRRLATLGEELIATVPAAESVDLTISLAKARFLSAEDVATRALLAQTRPGEVDAAVEIFRDVADTLGEIGDDAEHTVASIESRTGTNRTSRGPEARERLADARRRRSVCRFYAGWSRYHLAALSGSTPTARAALRDFAVLLNAVGDRPSVERVPASLLRYDHVAGAALGVALCHGLTGDHAAASNWLEMLENATDLGPAVSRQLFTQRSVILSRAGRWTALQHVAEDRRRAGAITQPSDDAAERVLSLAEARLLAVLALSTARGDARDSAARVLALAVEDLVRGGHIAHLLDLADRFGTLPLDNDSFVGLYVRGIRAADGVTAAQSESDTPDRPLSAAARAALESAATLLRAAINANDANDFPREQTVATFRLGDALLRLGRPRAAANAFESAAADASQPTDREAALWLTVAAYDRALIAASDSIVQAEITARRDAAAALYLREFSGTDRAARLTLGLPEIASSGASSIDTLAAVPLDSPFYDAAQRRLASLLYRKTLTASIETYQDHAAAFIAVASPLMSRDRAAVADPDRDTSRSAARALAIVALHTIDVVVRSPAPELTLAETAIADLTAIAARLGPSVASVVQSFEAVRLYEIVRVGAVARRPEHRDALADLALLDPPRAAAADRFLFNLALRRMTTEPDGMNSDDDRRAALRTGKRIIDRAGPAAVSAQDPAIVFVHDRAAAAAFELWQRTAADEPQAISFDLDRTLFDAGIRAASVLQRLAVTAESLGRTPVALDVWRVRFTAATVGTEAWYEARYNSIRLLAEIDPTAARQTLDQFVTLSPSLGGDNWRPSFEQLDAAIPPARNSDTEAREAAR